MFIERIMDVYMLGEPLAPSSPSILLSIAIVVSSQPETKRNPSDRSPTKKTKRIPAYESQAQAVL
jgi:hypothetical protein